MIETLNNFYKVLKAHAEFYEEEHQDLTVTFSLDQVKLLRNALMYLDDENEQNKETKELDRKGKVEQPYLNSILVDELNEQTNKQIREMGKENFRKAMTKLRETWKPYVRSDEE